MKCEAVLYIVDKKTRCFHREELGGYEENHTRRMSKVERVFDFMITGKDKHYKQAKIDLKNGIRVYRVIGNL